MKFKKFFSVALICLIFPFAAQSESIVSSSIQIEANVIERKVVIFAEYPETINLLDEIVIHSSLIGFDDCEIKYQWQSKNSQEEWQNIEGAVNDTYSFSATVENLAKSYRLIVMYKEGE